MQRIIVKNFGPLKDIDLEIKDYMVFLGPQASGKSTLAKLIYFFREIEITLYTYLLKNFENINDETIIKGLNEPINSRLSQFFGDYTFTDNIIVKFYVGKNRLLKHITLNYDSISQLFVSDVDLSFFKTSLDKKLSSPELSNFKTIFGIDDLIQNKNLFPVIAGLMMDKFDVLKKLNTDYFIPSNRAFIAKNYSPASTDTLSKEFYDFVGEIKNKFKKDYLAQIGEKKFFGSKIKNESSIQLCLKLIQSILRGRFIYEKNEEKIILENGQQINLRSAASGQQESIWVMNIIFYLLLENNDTKTIIEEPEAHLFPEAQKDLTYLISLLANQAGNQVIITTHSHYILGALNILINAHRIGQTSPEEVEKIVPKELWIDKNRLFAGFMENGTIKNIYDDEAEMIKIQQLNAVAGEINKDFDKLLDLEFANEKV